jgi:hypothetical protein
MGNLGLCSSILVMQYVARMYWFRGGACAVVPTFRDGGAAEVFSLQLSAARSLSAKAKTARTVLPALGNGITTAEPSETSTQDVAFSGQMSQRSR